METTPERFFWYVEEVVVVVPERVFAYDRNWVLVPAP
jgi:hypothetical protein